MPSPLLRRAAAVTLLAVLASGLQGESGRAAGPPATIILKDGYIIKGTARREGETIFDPASGAQIPVGNGFLHIDDGARRIILSSKLMQEVIPANADTSPDLVVLQRPFTPLNSLRLDAVVELTDIGPWTENWTRSLKFTPKPGTARQTMQHLNVLTPHYAVVQAQHHRWYSFYLTREFSPEVLRSLVLAHPDVKEKAGKVDPVKRLRAFRMLKQAGWYDLAEAELDRFQEDAPSEKAKIEEARKGLRSLQGEQLIQDLERAAKAGRHSWAQKKLADFPRDWVDDKQLDQVRKLRLFYEKGEKGVAAATRFLKELPGRTEAAERKVWEQAAAAMLADVDLDNVARLERFTQFAELAARDMEQGRTPNHAPGDLMALAVSGWLLGNGAAEAKAAVGLKLWRTRQFVLEYLKTSDSEARRRLLTAYEKAGAIAFDELAQLVMTLPPADPEAKFSTDVTEMETKEGGRRKGGTSYVLQVPPEYRHSRPAPVLLVLGNAGMKPKDMLEKWSELAGQHGFLLAAPDYNDGGGKGSYGYTTEEHRIVLEVLRDLQRRFNVDADRVFLAGFGEGGSAAFDIGLSHPDLFAGVLPMAASPRYFSGKYWSNSQNLPMYIVAGDVQAGDTAKNIRKPWLEHVVSSTAPVLYVEYKGRALEWFDAEVPLAFDWMSRKKRQLPFPAMGEYLSMRPTDNRFYWISADGIADRACSDARNFNYGVIPALLTAKVVDGTQINVTARGWKTVTVWLARDMVDFEKPLAIQVNLTLRKAQYKATPHIGVLLEDLYQRGDRQRPFVAKIEIPI